MRTQLVRAALLTAGGLVILGCWVVLGRQAADGLRGSDRYTVAFADIDCTPPAPFSRADFLGEVQYLSNLPDRLPLSDDQLANRLAAAFAAHAIVESVEHVEVLPRRVRVALKFRTPVLAIPGREGVRVVDGKGILLPKWADGAGLPVLASQGIDPPAGAAGRAWGDAHVEGAARLAALVQPLRETAPVERIVFEGEEYSFLVRGARFRWGRQPGREAPGEPDAASKLTRLRDLIGSEGTKSDREFDLSTGPKATAP
jgi:hypothetical protein